MRVGYECPLLVFLTTIVAFFDCWCDCGVFATTVTADSSISSPNHVPTPWSRVRARNVNMRAPFEKEIPAKSPEIVPYPSTTWPEDRAPALLSLHFIRHRRHNQKRWTHQHIAPEKQVASPESVPWLKLQPTSRGEDFDYELERGGTDKNRSSVELDVVDARNLMSSRAQVPHSPSKRKQDEWLFFVLSLSFFGIVAGVLFVRRCVKCPPPASARASHGRPEPPLPSSVLEIAEYSAIPMQEASLPEEEDDEVFNAQETQDL